MAMSAVSLRNFIELGGLSEGSSSAGGQDFGVEWIEFNSATRAIRTDARTGDLIIVSRGTLRIAGRGDVPEAVVGADSVALVTAGAHVLTGDAGTRCALIKTRRAGFENRPPFHRRQTLGSVQVLSFDEIKASPEKPRLKMLQTETLSINIVDYQGPRDRSALSPHSHADFEQGSLALEGSFVHHLRTPWGSDADAWRDDEHLVAHSPSLVVIPPHVIHTSEGTGEGRHVLIDVFSPPRQDFIASRWVFNAADFEPAAARA